MTVVDFDARRVRPYVEAALSGFINDPPDSEFQRGYLAALIAVYREAIGGNPSDARLQACERILYATRAANDPEA